MKVVEIPKLSAEPLADNELSACLGDLMTGSAYDIKVVNDVDV
jgi:hypothetical protein